MEELTQVHALIPRIENRVDISCRKTRHDGIEVITRAHTDDVVRFDSLFLQPQGASHNLILQLRISYCFFSTCIQLHNRIIVTKNVLKPQKISYYSAA